MNIGLIDVDCDDMTPVGPLKSDGLNDDGGFVIDALSKLFASGTIIINYIYVLHIFSHSPDDPSIRIRRSVPGLGLKSSFTCVRKMFHLVSKICILLCS